MQKQLFFGRQPVSIGDRNVVVTVISVRESILSPSQFIPVVMPRKKISITGVSLRRVAYSGIG